MAEQATNTVKSLRPFFWLTVYYVVGAVVLVAGVRIFPGISEYLPIGGTESFAGRYGQDIFEPVNLGVPDISPPARNAIELFLSMCGAFLLMLPVTWVYMGTRRRGDIAQAFVNTILLLPVAVTGVVFVVRNSLALAFSLAGIVAGVRFRHTLKDTGDAIYLFTAIGVGLSSGIGAIEIAAVLSIFFNYVILALWTLNFASGATGTQTFARNWMTKKERKTNPGQQRQEDEPPG